MKSDEPPGTLVTSLFGARVAAVRRYADLLRGAGVDLGFLGPQERDRIWQRHILNCAVTAPVFRQGSTVCDVGSGAGLPGIVLALSRPDLRITLIEPLLRRWKFLSDIVTTLDIPVEVVHSRAQELSKTRKFDYVTARAVAPLGRLVIWTLPLWNPDGELVAIKGQSVEQEIASVFPKLRRLTVSEPTIERWGRGVVTPPTTIVRIQSRASPSI